MRYNVCLLPCLVPSTAGSTLERMLIHVPTELSAKFDFVAVSSPDKQPGVLINNVKFYSKPSFTVRTSPIAASDILDNETSTLVHDLLTSTVGLDTLADAIDSIIIDSSELIRQEVSLTQHYMDLWDIKENQITSRDLQQVPSEDRATDVQLRMFLVEQVAPLVQAAFASFVASLDTSMAATFVQSVFDFGDKKREADVIAFLVVRVGAACLTASPSVLKLVINKAIDRSVSDDSIMDSVRAVFIDSVATQLALIKLTMLPMPSLGAVNMNGPYASAERNAYVGTVGADGHELRCMDGSSVRYTAQDSMNGRNPLSLLDSSVFKRFGASIPKLPIWGKSRSHSIKHHQSAYLICRYLGGLSTDVESVLFDGGHVPVKIPMRPVTPFDVNVDRNGQIEIVADQCKLAIKGLDYYGMNAADMTEELAQVFNHHGVDPCMGKPSLVALPKKVEDALAKSASVNEANDQTTTLSCYSTGDVRNQDWSVPSDHATNPFNGWFGFWGGFKSIPRGYDSFKYGHARGQKDLNRPTPIKTEDNLRFYCETLFHVRSLAQDHIQSKVVRRRVGRRSRAASDVRVEISGSKITADLQDMQYGSTLSLTLPAMKGATEDKVVTTVERYAALMSIDDVPKDVQAAKVEAVAKGLEEESPRGTLTCKFDGKVSAEYGFMKAIIPDNFNPFFGGVSRARMLQFCRQAYVVRLRIIEQIQN